MKRQADQLHHAMGVLSDRSITRMCAPMFMECMVIRPPKTAPFNGPPSCQVGNADLKKSFRGITGSLRSSARALSHCFSLLSDFSTLHAGFCLSSCNDFSALHAG